jgi:hypothetical protein
VILTYGSESGAFATLDLPTLDNGFTLTPVATGTSLILQTI